MIRLGIFSALVIHLTPDARAVEFICSDLMMPYIARPWLPDEELSPELYAGKNRILYLSDGITDSRWTSLGKKVAPHFPDKEFVSADFNYRGRVQSGNLRLVALDNNKEFPFKDDTFDLIVMRRGLCICHHDRCCGGFQPESFQAQQFFLEAARILNKNNPEARVVLQGAEGVDHTIGQTWFHFMSKVEAQYPVTVTFYFQEDSVKRHFLMIGIRPKDAPRP